MGCCGQNRRIWQSQQGRTPVPGPPQPPSLAGAVAIEYRGDTSIVIAGLVTGFTYVFPKTGEHLEVDGRDAPGVLSLGDFAIADHTSPARRG